MSAFPPFLHERDAAALAERALAAERRADDRLATAIDDFFLPDRDRLDEHTRAAIAQTVATTIGAIEREVSSHAARLLVARGRGEAAFQLERDPAGVLDRLLGSGLLRDPELMRELLALARLDLIDEALAANRAPGTVPTLLTRLSEGEDIVVRHRAVAFLIADNRRRHGAADAVMLPSDLHQRLVWWVAAALRERFVPAGDAVSDKALSEAAARSLAAHDDGARVEVAAMQLAIVVDAPADILPYVLVEALNEARLALFVAFLAHALGVEGAEARALVLEPHGDRLWLALRTLGFDREALAEIGWRLTEADRDRNVELLADTIDAAATVTPEAAAPVIAALTLNRDFRAAVRALARSAPAERVA